MRDDAARALRVDDEVPRDRGKLHSVALLDPAEPRTRGVSGPSPEATMALRHFEAIVDGSGAGDPPARRFARDTAPPSRGTERPAPAVAALAIEEPAAEPDPEPIRAPRSAPGRSYGSHRRADGVSVRARGYQPGRRTVEITGQAQAPRRRPSTTTTAMVARPDRVALWAFMLAMFLVLMAVATAHAAI